MLNDHFSGFSEEGMVEKFVLQKVQTEGTRP
jgi:hypothetical protein